MAQTLRRILIISVLFALGFNSAKAQRVLCDHLQALVKSIAADSTMKDLRLAETKDHKNSKRPEYKASLAIMENDQLSMVFSMIIYNDAEQHYSHFTMYNGMGDETKEIKDKIKTCLGDGWVFEMLSGREEGDTMYYYKNPVNFVVVKVCSIAGQTAIECYNDARNRAPVCVTGDCDNYMGELRYFNGDTYTGTFINGGLNGLGYIKWRASGTAYQGSFVDNQMAGSGQMLDANDKVIASGIFFKGEVVQLDTSQKTCQHGDCQTGFGLKVFDQGYYIGNFKDGFLNGPGEIVHNGVTFYGNFVNNKLTGKAIYFNKQDESTFTTYEDGKPKGLVETDYPDQTSREADATSGAGRQFDIFNILIKAGAWVRGTFTEQPGVEYADVKAFAQSVREFYDSRKIGYKDIKGEAKTATMADKLQVTMGLPPNHKSKKSFLNTFETSIEVDKDRYYYIHINLSGKSPVTSWAALYNKYYQELNNITGSKWKSLADDGHADAVKRDRSFILEYMFDTSKTIHLTFDRTYGVFMEIH